MSRSFIVVASLMSILLVFACARETSFQPIGRRQTPQQPLVGLTSDPVCEYPGTWWTPKPGQPSTEYEEEVFGHITSAGGDWSVTISSTDATTISNQASFLFSEGSSVPINFGAPCKEPNDGGSGHANTGAEWGWYGFGDSFGHQCRSTSDETQDDPERHRTDGGPFPPSYEVHCVNAGLFTLTLNRDAAVAFKRTVDFIGYDKSTTRRLENLSAPPGPANVDVLVDVADGTGPAANPVLSISATRSITDPGWSPLSLQQGAYHAPSNFYVRFDAGASVPASGVQNTQLLVRYFWTWPTDLDDRSGYTNTISEGLPVVRVKRFSAGSRTVRLHLVQPYEHPAQPSDESASDYGAAIDLPFVISDPLTASISPNPATVTARNPMQFTAGGLDGAGGPQYQWTFGDGGTSAVANPAYTYQSPGSYTVTLIKTDQYGSSVSTSGSVAVTDPPPTGLSATGVAATSTTIYWTNGNPGSTTTIRYRVTGTQTWSTGVTAAAGADSLVLVGLSPCTTYDVNAYHVIAATTVNALFRTTATGGNACAPSNFAVQACHLATFHGQNVIYFDVAWTGGEFSTGSTFEIGEGTSDDPASASVIQSGPSSTTTATLGPYARTDNLARYFWVRHKLSGGTGASTWSALADSPLRGSQTCGGPI